MKYFLKNYFFEWHAIDDEISDIAPIEYIEINRERNNINIEIRIDGWCAYFTSECLSFDKDTKVYKLYDKGELDIKKYIKLCNKYFNSKSGYESQNKIFEKTIND